MKMTLIELRNAILDNLCNNPDSSNAINGVLAMVGDYFGVDRAYIIENSEDGLFCSNTYEWCNNGIEPEMQLLQHVSYQNDLDMPAEDLFKNSDTFFCKDINSLTPKIRSILKKQSITGVLFCAIREHGKFMGFIGFDNCSENMALWEQSRDAIDTLEYTAHLMTLAIYDYRKRAEQLAEKDAELQAKNLYLERILSGINCGVVLYRVDKNRSIHVDFVNKYIAEMSDCSQSELIEAAQSDSTVTINPPYKKAFSAAFQTALECGRASLTYQATTLNGTEKWISVILSTSSNASGEAIINGTFFDISEEKNTQNKLKESAAIVEMALHSADAMIWTYDFRTRRINGKASSFHRHLFGNIIDNAPESLIECGYVHSDYVNSYRKLFESAAHSKTAVQGDFRVINPDGTGYFWERIILEPQLENGSVTSAIGISINISDWKIKENKFQQLVEKMDAENGRHLIAKCRYNLSANCCLYFKGTSENIDKLNASLSFDDATSRLLKTAESLSDREKIVKALDRRKLLKDFSEGAAVGEIEYRRIRSGADSSWSKINYTMLEEPYSGEIVIFAYAFDITESVFEKSMLEKLSAIEYDVLGLIDVKTHRFERKSIRGVKSAANPNDLPELTEDVFEKVVHSQLFRVIDKNEREELMKRLTVDEITERLNETPLYTIAFSAKRIDEGHARKQLNFTYLDDARAMIFFYCTDITDIFDREQAQLRETENALAKAKSASESKTEFFSRMSHDMRTPMNGILGIAKLSEQETDADVLRDNIAKIEASGQYLLGLINDTLDFQRIESGKLQLCPQIISCRELIGMSEEMIKPAAEKKGIRFKVINCENYLDGFIRIDPVRIKQIFINLISNAIKFTPAGGTIEFELMRLNCSGNTTRDRFYVRDSGLGMSRDFLQNRIFKPFSQESNSVTGLYAGSGLGLSIVKSLVELMNGTISVESELGSGTTFIIELPVEHVDREKAEAARAVIDRQNQSTIVNLKGKHILLAEDHPLNAEIASRLLKRAGCTTVWAKNGRECADIFSSSAQGEFNAILMDIRMPVMDGLAAAKEIRASAHPDAKAIPIIAMTANAYDEDVNKSLEAGMNAHIAKPIDTTAMFDTISRLISQK